MREWGSWSRMLWLSIGEEGGIEVPAWRQRRLVTGRLTGMC